MHSMVNKGALGMFTESWEQETLALLQEAEVEKLDAERRLEKARDDLMDKTRAVESVRLVIEQYRHKYSVPNEHIESPVLELQYSSLGPIGQIDSWASKHEGEVIITELLTELVRSQSI